MFVIARAPEAAYSHSHPCVHACTTPSGPANSPHQHPRPRLPNVDPRPPLFCSAHSTLHYWRTLWLSSYSQVQSLLHQTPRKQLFFSVLYHRFRCIFIHCFWWFVGRVGLAVSVSCI
ncbi:hypothetical protein DAEQUDRAFT_558232 [Daedalea quercina L-15889]|uniref:Uncharacterized protein n=1 Tax=Daedalea quercina L-15889 TaxID=1314783 RepID=A0A165M279_9APHY|nr:hypothetical protein DAEQUDRAFT_558232 [Daedalea quercina L-15889]